MKRKLLNRCLRITLVALLFSACLFFSSAVKAGIERAVSQCFSAVLPSLFPIFIGMELLRDLPASQSSFCLFSPIRRLLRLSENGFSVFLLGLLSGYPAGISALCERLEDREVSKEEALYLLHFCSNAGPAFLFGVLGGAVFQSLIAAALLWGIQILSTVCTAFVFRPPQQFESLTKSRKATASQPSFFILLLTAVRKAGQIMLLLCTYIVAFSVPVSVLGMLPNLPELFRTIFGGLLELSGGLLKLGNSGLPDFFQFVLASGLCAFGGICVFAQSAEFLVSAKLPLRPLFIGKCVQSMLAVSFSACIYCLRKSGDNLSKSIILAVIVVIPIIFLFFRKNRTGNHAKTRV